MPIGSLAARKKRRAQLLVMVGASLVVLLLCVAGAVVRYNDTGGRYSAWDIENACSLVNPSGLQRWAGPREGAPDNNELRGYRHAELRCTINFQDTNDPRTWGTFQMRSSIGPTVKEEFEQLRELMDLGTTSGKLSGLGDDAFFYADELFAPNPTSVKYELYALDDNLLMEISAYVHVGDDVSLSANDLAPVCKTQARKILAELS